MGHFVHLHLHSEYSLLDGACRIADIPRAAKKCGHTAVAITDHGVMYGAVNFYNACKKEGIKPIIGCEVYVAPRSASEKESGRDAANSHLVLLVKNEAGYRNLIYMVSKSFTEGFYVKPRVDMEMLAAHSEGLMALSACLSGQLPKLILSGEYDKAEKLALEYKKMFGGDYYLELQDHGIPDQKTVNAALVRISEKCGIPLVATNDVHYINKDDSSAQEILMCIQTNSSLDDESHMKFPTDEFYYKSTEEMERLFPDHPEAVGNTKIIADKCSYDFVFGKHFLPRYTCPDGRSADEYLRSLTTEGFGRRITDGYITFEWGERAKYEAQIEHELDVIGSMGYSEYFLITWDFVHYAKSKGIPVGPGRGSGAGSLVAYLIGITDVDPIRFGLLFERFLNPERVSMPDFDIDFCYYRRGEVIDYVREKYGDDHISQIITFGTLAAKAAIRGVGRALGMPYSEVDRVAKLISGMPGVSLEETMKSKRFAEVYQSSTEIKRLVDTARSIEGMPSHVSIHAAGVVITDKPVCDYIPLATSGGIPVTQFTMTTVEKLGLLKFDFLALRYLTVIESACEQIRERVPDFDVHKVDIDDAATYKLLSDGNTDGVFQLESAGVRRMLTQLCPENIEDIIASIALYRPGPIESGAIPKYIAVRHDRSKMKFVSPLLEPILSDTCGFIIYQEQVMQIFCTLAGYSLGKADIVRRAISKKNREALKAERDAFLEGAKSHGMTEADASGLFDDIVGFANYAFNKSHAAAYGMLSFYTAYLKAHYPVEYNCALLTSVEGSPEKSAEYIMKFVKDGIRILPPSVNESRSDFHVDGKNIRYGLSGLKNIGRKYVDEVIIERGRNGRFVSFENFLERTASLGTNRKQLESLIKAGAFDNMGLRRSQLLASYERLLENRQQSAGMSLPGQLNMFSMSDIPKTLIRPKFEYPDLPELSSRQKLKLEKEVSGLYFSGHLLDDYTEHITLLNVTSIRDIKASFEEAPDDTSGTETASADIGDTADTPSYKSGDVVTVCGIVTARVNKTTKAGANMAFVTLEDRLGDIETVVFAKSMDEYGQMLTVDTAAAVFGSISVDDDGTVKLLLRRAFLLYENGKLPEYVRQNPEGLRERKKSTQPTERTMQAPTKTDRTAHSRPTAQQPAAHVPTKLYLRVESTESETFRRAEAIIGIFEGTFPVIFYDVSKGKYVKYGICGIALTPYVKRELENLLGDGSVILK